MFTLEMKDLQMGFICSYDVYVRDSKLKYPGSRLTATSGTIVSSKVLKRYNIAGINTKKRQTDASSPIAKFKIMRITQMAAKVMGQVMTPFSFNISSMRTFRKRIMISLVAMRKSKKSRNCQSWIQSSANIKTDNTMKIRKNTKTHPQTIVLINMPRKRVELPY